MPSQNLPKPNLPGQTNQIPVLNSNPGVTLVPNAAPAASSATASLASQTVFNQKPNQIRQAQIIPGGLSRENPGGTPPNMRVEAPPSSSIQNDLKKPEPPAQSLPNRPMGPLGQMSIKNDFSQVADKAQVASPVTQGTVVQASPVEIAKDMTKPETETKSSAPQISPAISQAPSNETKPTQPEKKSFNPLTKLKQLPKPALIGGAVLILILLGLLIFSLFKPKTSSSKPSTKTTTGSTSTNTNNTSTSDSNTAQITTLTYWGLWEDSQILKEVIAGFESKNPTIKIDYRKQSHRDYRERLQQAIASGNGPDIFRYHVAWVQMLSAELSAMPSTVMTATEYKQVFYPTAYNNLQVGGNIVGIPLMYDGLALFYNKEMLKTANIDVPTTWAELRTAANKLTVPANVSERQNGNITRAGLAIGNAGNVDHFSDILALLIIQNGGNPAEAGSQYVKDAITFYTNFIKQDKIWSDRLANSTTAFAKGDVAMIFAPSWRVHDIKNLNPNLDFAVARLPQLDIQKPAAWATFWAEGVNTKSKNKDAAWSFLKYLSTPEVLRKFYNDASQYRAFGEIYPRTDMVEELKSNELVGAYLADAPIAKSWYMSSFTHDNGLNDQIIKYYEDAINAVLSSTDTEKALETAVSGVNSVLTKYSSK
jgi:multiple sugar transport system substrate-binding protein